MITKKQLERFIRIRNRSGFTSNIQFMFDADEAGFDAADLGDALKTQRGYVWRTPHGDLIEDCNGLRLEPK